MRLRRLLSPTRFLRCLRTFRQPFRAHWKLSYTQRNTPPIDLVFRNGQVLRQGPGKAMRRLWDSILYGKAGELPVTYKDGLLSFGWCSRRLSIRPLSEDFGVFCEVFLEDVYCLDGLGSVDRVVDLGGHIGLFAARLAPVAKQVITVEPNPDNLALLRLNVKDFGSRVTVVPLVVSSATGETLTLYKNQCNTGGHSLDAEFAMSAVAAYGGDVSAIESMDVESISLSDLFDRCAVGYCDLLKCDIEGAEYAVFDSADLDTLNRIERILIECHGHPGEDTTRIEKLEARLRDAGFNSIRRHRDCAPPRDGSKLRPWSGILEASRSPKAPELR